MPSPHFVSLFFCLHSSAGASRGFTLDVAFQNDEEMIVDFYKRHWGILQELRLRFLMLVQADYWQQFRDGYLGRDTVRKMAQYFVLSLSGVGVAVDDSSSLLCGASVRAW